MRRLVALLLVFVLSAMGQSSHQSTEAVGATVSFDALNAVLRKKNVSIRLVSSQILEGRFVAAQSGMLELREKKKSSPTILPASAIDTIEFRRGPSNRYKAIGGVVGGTTFVTMVLTGGGSDSAAAILPVLLGATLVTALVGLINRPKMTIRLDPSSIPPATQSKSAEEPEGSR